MWIKYEHNEEEKNNLKMRVALVFNPPLVFTRKSRQWMLLGNERGTVEKYMHIAFWYKCMEKCRHANLVSVFTLRKFNKCFSFCTRCVDCRCGSKLCGLHTWYCIDGGDCKMICTHTKKNVSLECIHMNNRTDIDFAHHELPKEIEVWINSFIKKNW